MRSLYLSALRYVCILLIFWTIASSTPIQPPLLPPSISTDACSRLTSLPHPLSFTLPHNLTISYEKWPINPSLTLALTICNWEPSPATILSVLSAALAAIGKKRADAVLEEKFVQRSDNKYNTLYFEIGPVRGWGGRKVLTWRDVGEVLGEERGLVRFFRETRLWHTVYFAMVDKDRGVLGEGAVRRWWQ